MSEEGVAEVGGEPRRASNRPPAALRMQPNRLERLGRDRRTRLRRTRGGGYVLRQRRKGGGEVLQMRGGRRVRGFAAHRWRLDRVFRRHIHKALRRAGPDLARPHEVGPRLLHVALAEGVELDLRRRRRRRLRWLGNHRTTAHRIDSPRPRLDLRRPSEPGDGIGAGSGGVWLRHRRLEAGHSRVRQRLVCRIATLRRPPERLRLHHLCL